ncbi:hypothetical protein [Microvirga puerhi]|uniref:Uncharacterized protein n=1 Tax=Microvirga puerhi TaxID=2876078 RepID=A0ABS7VSE1_9HYPH|nr:hypothetical protein [Microvirga puerhi]MBZ6078455.1 hypothetical protein [Microvirga puerhi]
MSTSTQKRLQKHKPGPLKDAPQAKVAAKSQQSGLSREEIRQIVIEMIG